MRVGLRFFGPLHVPWEARLSCHITQCLAIGCPCFGIHRGVGKLGPIAIGQALVTVGADFSGFSVGAFGDLFGRSWCFNPLLYPFVALFKSGALQIDGIVVRGCGAGLTGNTPKSAATLSLICVGQLVLLFCRRKSARV